MGLLTSSNKNSVTNNSTVNDNRVAVGDGANVIDLGGGVYDQSVTDASTNNSFSDYSVKDYSDRSFTDNSVTTATDSRAWDYSVRDDSVNTDSRDYSVKDYSDRSFTDQSVTTATDSRSWDYSVSDSSDRSFTDQSVKTDSRDYSVNDSSDRSFTDNSKTDVADSRSWDYSVNDSSDRSFNQNYNITALDGGAIAGIEGTAKAAIGGAGNQLSMALDFGRGALNAANETTRTTAGLLTDVLGSQQEFARGFVADFYKSQQTEQERGFDRLTSMGTVIVLVIGAAWALRRG